MYDRNLIDYLPPFERNVKEFDAILTQAEQPEMVLLWDAYNDILNDQFIMDATENGVSRWEKILGIVPKATETLESRKFTILTRTSEQPPFTLTALEKQLETLCGAGNYEVTRDVSAKILYVRVALAAKSNFNDVGVLLERIVPANMLIDLSLKYNQHERMTSYTHEALQSMTHEDIRNEVE
jgi:hypothetical protein